MERVLPDVYLRHALPEDIDRVAELEKISFSCPWTKRMIRREILGPSRTRFIVAVAWHGAELVGYVSYQIVAGELHILSLATAPAFRRRGVAQILLKACLEIGMERGATVAHLEVRESNTPAISLYSKLGFKQVGRRARYYSKPVEDALLFAIDLTAIPAASPSRRS